jgi:hypothetical protein
MICFPGYHVANPCPVQSPAQDICPHESHAFCAVTVVGTSLQMPTRQGDPQQPEMMKVIPQTRTRKSLFGCISLFPFTQPRALYAEERSISTIIQIYWAYAGEIRRRDHRESYLAHPSLNYRTNNQKNRENQYKFSYPPNRQTLCA